MAVNWDLFRPVDTGAMWRRGWERGRARRKEYDLKNALSAFGADPSNPQAQSALAQLSPEFAMKLASHRWELQQKEAERQRIGALLGPDPSGVPAGINGQPKINFRERQMAALRAGDTAAATALGSMADDQERRADLEQKKTVVSSEFNPVTGAETYYDWQHNPIGDDQHPFVRDAQGRVYKHGTVLPADGSGQPVEPAPPPDPMTPSGDPLAPAPDPSIAVAPKAKILADALAVINQGVSPEQEAAIWAEAAKYGVHPPETGAPQ
jgi:hypothetical protein